MFSKRSLFQIMIAGFVLIAQAPLGFAGESGSSGMGGGGNYLGREFVRYARDGIESLLSNPCFPNAQIDTKALTAKLGLFILEGEKRVSPTQASLFAIDSKTGKKVEVDAINYPDLDLVEFNVDRWSALSERGKRRLAAHEFLGLIRAEGSNDFHLSDPSSQDTYELDHSELKNLFRSAQPVELEAVLESSPTTPSSMDASLWIDYNGDSKPKACGLERLSDVMNGSPDTKGDCEIIVPQYVAPRAGWTNQIRWRFQIRGYAIDQTRFRAELFLGAQSPYRFRVYVRSLGEAAGLIYEGGSTTVSKGEWIDWAFETAKAKPVSCQSGVR